MGRTAWTVRGTHSRGMGEATLRGFPRGLQVLPSVAHGQRGVHPAQRYVAPLRLGALLPRTSSAHDYGIQASVGEDRTGGVRTDIALQPDDACGLPDREQRHGSLLLPHGL